MTKADFDFLSQMWTTPEEMHAALISVACFKNGFMTQEQDKQAHNLYCMYKFGRVDSRYYFEKLYEVFKHEK